MISEAVLTCGVIRDAVIDSGDVRVRIRGDGDVFPIHISVHLFDDRNNVVLQLLGVPLSVGEGMSVVDRVEINTMSTGVFTEKN